MRLFPLLSLLVIALPARAQDPQPPTPHGEYRIAGTVVSSVDNHPLQRATVDLLAPDNTRTVTQTTTSDEFGHFAFTGVSAGNHILRGETHNYLSTEYEQHEGFTTGIITGAGVDTESLVLKLVPAASIAGTVRDETGDPVANATIHLFRQSLGLGDGRLQNAGVGSTDDRGRFEFPRLQPGSYFLAITAHPWFAIYPTPPRSVSDQADARDYAISMRQRNQQPIGIADSIDPSLDVAYPACFYPGTTDPAAASAIPLRGADALDLTFSLSSVPAVTFMVPISPAKGNQQALPQLMLNFRGQTLSVQAEQSQMNGQATFVGLAPGDYTLRSSPAPAGFTPYSSTGVASSSATAVHIDRSTSIADLPPAPASAHVHAVLHSADGSPPPARLSLGLLPSNSTDESFATTDAKGEITLDAPPGVYSVDAAASGRRLYVRQIVSGAKPQAGNQVHLDAGDNAVLSIFFSAATHGLRGFARKGGKPFAGAFVLMLPMDRPIANSTAFRDQTNLDGSFELSGLAPGAYTLLAIDGGWDVDWRRPEVLAHYLPGALTVHIADSAEKIQPLREPLPVQPR
jgi:hypothetical protein